MKQLVVLGALILLAGCGGGGGTDNGTPNITLTPSAISTKVYEGDNLSFNITASIAGDNPGSIFLDITDTQGLIVQSFGKWVHANPDMSYTVAIESNPGLSPGNYSSTINAKICSPSACNGNNLVATTSLQLALTVLPGTNLKTLATVDGLGPWTTYQANNQHTGYVPITVTPADISQRWVWRGDIREAGQPAIVNGVVYASFIAGGGSFGTPLQHWVRAFDEHSGDVLWSYEFNDTFTINPVAYGNGQLFLTTISTSQVHEIHALDTVGNHLFAATTIGQWDRQLAPVYAEGFAYFNNDQFLHALNAESNLVEWVSQENLRSDTTTPAVFEGKLYQWASNHCDTCDDAGLAVYDKATGIRTDFISHQAGDKAQWSSMDSAPMVVNASAIITKTKGDSSENQLVSFNATNSTVNWALDGRFKNYAVDPEQQVVYVTNGNPFRLEARSLTSGALLWSWAPTPGNGATFTGNVIATNNLVFVSTDTKAFAIDTTSHAAVWDYYSPGSMAISDNGVLYITGWQVLRAINLK